MDEELKKSSMIQTDHISSTIQKLRKVYTESLGDILSDPRNCEIIASTMQPLPRKILKTDFLVSENEEDANKNLKKEEKDDDLECDEDDFADIIDHNNIDKCGEYYEEGVQNHRFENNNKSTITEYSVRKYLILRQFIDILSDLEKNCNEKSSLANHKDSNKQQQPKLN